MTAEHWSPAGLRTWGIENIQRTNDDGVRITFRRDDNLRIAVYLPTVEVLSPGNR
jgi:hypothetical protein